MFAETVEEFCQVLKTKACVTSVMSFVLHFDHIGITLNDKFSTEANIYANI